MLHMLSNLITPERLQNGLQQYLKDHAFANVVEADLWGSVTQVLPHGYLNALLWFNPVPFFAGTR